MVTIWRADFPENTNPLRFFLYASRPHGKQALIAMAAMAAGSTIFTSVSYVFKLITDAVAALPGGGYDAVFFAAGLYILALLVGQLAVRASGFYGARWATGARATARYALTAYVTLHSRSYFSSRFAGSVGNKINRASNGVAEFVVQTIWQFLDLIVSIAASFVIAFYTSAALAWIFLFWVLVVLVINVYFARKRVPLSGYAQRLETALNGATVDLLSNITAMHEYARRLFEIERLKTMTDSRRRAGLASWHYSEWVLVLNGVLQAVFGGVLVIAAVRFAQLGQISPGDIVLMVSLIFRIESLLLFMGAHLNGFAENWGEVEDSLSEIMEPHEIGDKPGAKVLRVTRGDLSFHQVSFSYAGEQMFDTLTFNIPAGERVGLVGKSGAGKSTLIRLILRHHDLEGGMITIDGVDISTVTQESLREAISVVPQEPLLFHRTIRENISYGKPDATEAEIIAAAKSAQAHEFIMRLPDQYEAMVGERGVKLSGGERQRIAIARAIIKNAPILLLDEATSALDSESELSFQRALSELMKGKTVIAIAHRLSTLREMDRIMVMDRGAIIEEGKHDELVAKGGVYAELWRHQAGGFLQE